MRILGLDVGDVLIGVAVSDPMEIIANGLDSIKRTTPKEDVKVLKNIADEYEVEKMVIGLPKMMNGEIGIQAEKVLEFAEFLKITVNVPIIMWDERLTTAAATRTLIEADMSRKKRKKVVDKVAATIILQNYLDSRS